MQRSCRMVCHALHLITSMLRTLLPFLALLAVTLQAQEHKQWFKGNTHTHTLWSDGNDFPEMVVDWYQRHGYQFLAISDHNVIHAKEVWMAETAVEKRRKALGKTTMQKYLARFGPDWVQKREIDGTSEVRLRKLEEYRPMFEKPGVFQLIQAEEISAKFNSAPLHMNVINVVEAIKPLEGTSITDTIRRNLQAVQAQQKATGKPMFTHLNHPNFQWALTAEDLAEVQEENFFEVYNGHPKIYFEGDDKRVGCEKLWDIANTLRITKFHAPPLFGVATDDAHHYHGEDSSPGRGWVMVRAASLQPDTIVNAMKAGDFYASSGVVIDELTVTQGTLHLRIHGEPGVTYTTHIIGTPENYDASTTSAAMPAGDPHPTRNIYSGDVGKTFAKIQGTDVTYKPAGNELYLRATIISSKPHVNPSYPGQVEMAWVQPWILRKSQ